MRKKSEKTVMILYS